MGNQGLNPTAHCEAGASRTVMDTATGTWASCGQSCPQVHVLRPVAWVPETLSYACPGPPGARVLSSLSHSLSLWGAAPTRATCQGSAIKNRFQKGVLSHVGDQSFFPSNPYSSLPPLTTLESRAFTVETSSGKEDVIPVPAPALNNSRAWAVT